MSKEEEVDLTTFLKDKFKIRVSSVLNREVKEYGKQFMFDGREDTCWNSDQGNSQAISFQCESTVMISKLQIQFQGGFAGKDCNIELKNAENDEKVKCEFYPEDINQMQIFPITPQIPVKSFKINFYGSTDFFGRIIIYQLQIFGKDLSS